MREYAERGRTIAGIGAAFISLQMRRPEAPTNRTFTLHNVIVALHEAQCFLLQFTGSSRWPCRPPAWTMPLAWTSDAFVWAPRTKRSTWPSKPPPCSFPSRTMTSVYISAPDTLNPETKVPHDYENLIEDSEKQEQTRTTQSWSELTRARTKPYQLGLDPAKPPYAIPGAQA